MWSADIPKIVEPSRDALGWLLVYSRDVDGHREGDPVGDPDYFQSRYAAKKKADAMNACYRESKMRAAPKP